MAILEVGAHIGDIGDEVANRVRPATAMLIDAARAGTTYVDRLLHTDARRHDRRGSASSVHGRRAPRDDVGRRPDDVIVPKFVTRC